MAVESKTTECYRSRAQSQLSASRVQSQLSASRAQSQACLRYAETKESP